MAADDDRIGPTAHYTAYVWHRLGMPHGELFATPLGRALFWGFRLGGEGLASTWPGVPSMTQYLELRHRGIEEALARERPDAVVELGAGLSRRGITWAARGVRYVEVDLPAMVTLKRRLIAARASPALRARTEGRLVHAAEDVRGPGFEDRLRAWLEGAERPVVIAEGLLGYFAMADRRRLARAVAAALDGRGAFLSELRTGSEGAAVGAATRFLKLGIRLVTRGRGTREDFATLDAIGGFFDEAGFGAHEALPPVDRPHLRGLRLPARVFRAR